MQQTILAKGQFCCSKPQAPYLCADQHAPAVLVDSTEVLPVGVLPVGLDPADVLTTSKVPFPQAVSPRL
jgi:hypothetical protein